jgi:hypothetical protein
MVAIIQSRSLFTTALILTQGRVGKRGCVNLSRSLTVSAIYDFCKDDTERSQATQELSIMHLPGEGSLLRSARVSKEITTIAQRSFIFPIAFHTYFDVEGRPL